MNIPDEAAAWRFVEDPTPAVPKVLLQCSNGHPIGHAVEDGLWLHQRIGGHFWHPDFDRAELGRVPAWCDTCKVEGNISVATAMKAVHQRKKRLRMRMSNKNPR